MRFFQTISVWLLLAAPAAAQTISPLHRTEILSGAKFDVKIEFDSEVSKDSLNATLNGKPLADIFGKSADYLSAIEGTQKTSFTWRDVILKDDGDYVLKVSQQGLIKDVRWTVYPAKTRKAKNVILFVGDGMSMGHRTAARILTKGISDGRFDGELAMDDMPHMALVSTLPSDSISTDSANTASAYASGVKAPVGALNVFADSSKDKFDNARMETLGSLAKRSGLSVGIITDADITDATPASMYGHSSDRDESIPLLDQLYAFQPDIVMGGGIRQFTPQSVKGSKRKDEIDYIEKFEKSGYAVVKNLADLNVIQDKKKVLGLFSYGHMDGVLDRKFLKAGGVKEFPNQPDLTEQLQAALKILSKNQNGFVLLVEAALIDKYTHSLDMERSVYDTIMLDNGVKIAKDWAEKRNNDTLILVVADHGHPVSLVGTINDDMTKEPMTNMRERVGVYEHAGLPNYPAPNAEGYPPRIDVSRRIALFSAATPDYYETFRPKMDRPFKPTVEDEGGATYSANPAYKDVPGAMFREGILPKSAGAEVHSGDDVILTAMGPGSDQVRGHIDNTKVFRIIAEALGLGSITAKKK